MQDAFHQIKAIDSLCHTPLSILSQYYSWECMPPMKDFILGESHEQDSRVIFQETESFFYIGIQFSKEIFEEIKSTQILKDTKQKYISIHSAAVIAEELSHFKMILDAVSKQKNISLLEIETIGEIDRFLCLMHWNQKNTHVKIPHDWQNIHDICDCVFYGDRFKHENAELYIKAENRAFYHLKKAFWYEWDHTYYDFSSVNRHAAEHFKNLRESIFYVR